MKRLMRTTYTTDYDPNEPEVLGSFSANIPENADWQVVNIDWSQPGWVEVTFLIPSGD